MKQLISTLDAPDMYAMILRGKASCIEGQKCVTTYAAHENELGIWYIPPGDILPIVVIRVIRQVQVCNELVVIGPVETLDSFVVET